MLGEGGGEDVATFRGEGDLETVLTAVTGGHGRLGTRLCSGLAWGEAGYGGWATFLPPCCIRQWILNQLDLLPYLEPDLDIPTIRHFLSLQALHEVLFFLSTTHLYWFLHSEITDWLLQVRPKKDLQPSQVKAPKWKPAAGSPQTLHGWF